MAPALEAKLNMIDPLGFFTEGLNLKAIESFIRVCCGASSGAAPGIVT